MRKLFLLFLFVFSIAPLHSRDSIAVLDAILLDESPSWNIAIQRAVTDIVIEKILEAGTYRILDRSSVDEVLSEISFQVSGLVRDAEVRRAGEYLGADFVCVIRVGHPFDDVYSISASIINVESGEVVAQTSQNQQGNISILFEISDIIGTRLATGSVKEDIKPAEEQPKPSRLRPSYAGVSLGMGYGYYSLDDYDDEVYDGEDDWEGLGLYGGLSFKFGFLRYFSIRPSAYYVLPGGHFLWKFGAGVNFYPDNRVSPFLHLFTGFYTGIWGIGGDAGLDISIDQNIVVSVCVSTAAYYYDDQAGHTKLKLTGAYRLPRLGALTFP